MVRSPVWSVFNCGSGMQRNNLYFGLGGSTSGQKVPILTGKVPADGLYPWSHSVEVWSRQTSTPLASMSLQKARFIQAAI